MYREAKKSMDKENFPVWESEYVKAKKRLQEEGVTSPEDFMGNALDGFVQSMNAVYVREVMEIIEVLGLEDKQESSAKKLIKRTLYELMEAYQGVLQCIYSEFLEDVGFRKEKVSTSELPPGVPPKGFVPKK